MGRYFDRLTAPQLARFLVGLALLSSFGVVLGMGLTTASSAIVVTGLAVALGVVVSGG